MYCDVASEFNFQIGHFLHLYRVERESYSPLHNMIQNTIKKVWLACVQLYLLNLPYKRMLRHRSALKKKQFVVHQSKKNSDCADITKIKDEKIQIF